MSVGNRYLGWSHDGGELWLNPIVSPELPDGARGRSYGCMGGLIRLPIEGADVLLYSNLDTEAGVLALKCLSLYKEGPPLLHRARSPAASNRLLRFFGRETLCRT